MNISLTLGTPVTGDQRILNVKGELDLAVSAPFGKALRAALAATPPGGELVVDLSEVRFFDVSALRALLGAMHDAKAMYVAVQLIGSPTVNRMLEVLEIDIPSEPAHSIAVAPYATSSASTDSTLPPIRPTHARGRLGGSYSDPTHP